MEWKLKFVDNTGKQTLDKDDHSVEKVTIRFKSRIDIADDHGVIGAATIELKIETHPKVRDHILDELGLEAVGEAITIIPVKDGSLLPEHQQKANSLERFFSKG
ncbi:MAG: hypothetical protein ACFFD4_02470 [Candidatus Odinarchaeota archaeon]